MIGLTRGLTWIIPTSHPWIIVCVEQYLCRPSKQTAILISYNASLSFPCTALLDLPTMHVLRETSEKALPAAPSDSSMTFQNRRTGQSAICSACQCDQIPVVREQSYTVQSGSYLCSRTAWPFWSNRSWIRPRCTLTDALVSYEL
jgi:hypothetical protein